MLVNKRATLLGVALEASFVSAQESEAAGFERLLDVSPAAFDGDSLVRVVTIGAAHFAFEHRMMVRQLERRANFQVTLETSLRRLAWIDDRVCRAAALHMQTSWSMARLAADVLRVLSLRHQPCMCCSAKVARDIFVAGLAFLGADEFRARNAGRRENCSICGSARKQYDGERDCSPGAPKNFLALTVDPSS